MNQRSLICVVFVFSIAFFAASSSWAQLPSNPAWRTVLARGDVVDGVTVGNMEGLTGDNNGNFYVADRGELDGGADPNNEDTCHVWRINAQTGTVDLVGQITLNPCRPSGLTFDANGDLFITTAGGGGIIYQLTPNATNPTDPSATGVVYANGLPGANGVAFLGDDLFVTDGTANRGRVWKIGPGGGTCEGAFINCVEFFRIQPRRNSTDLGGNVATSVQEDGVGSERYTVPRHTIDPVNNLDRQGITANGIAFNADGDIAYVADTSRGAIWAAELDNNGNLVSATGCDPTFHPNTLCMDSFHVGHPLLEGIDGFILLVDGTILASVNERNAIVAVATDNEVTDAFQNAARPSNLLRNGDGSQQRPLEFPTSPYASGTRFCTTNADSPRRDNNPNAPGEGSKVNCIVQSLSSPGLPLPVQ